MVPEPRSYRKEIYKEHGKSNHRKMAVSYLKGLCTRIGHGPQGGAFITITDTNARTDITVSTVTTPRITEESQPSTSASNQTTHLRRLYDDLERHLRSLDAMHQDVTQDVFISMITSKLPKEVLIQLEIQKGNNERWTVGKLRQFFNTYITAREAAESQSKETHTGPSSEEKQQSKIQSNNSTLHQEKHLSAEALMTIKPFGKKLRQWKFNGLPIL
ncbi:unnamed protein product [Mytilus edulis]|uniref:Uncharacterized protein n=1 Tax=Mytilus edulis TaxID=6550 RepID=A0A8S3QT59_MYTED|nr:unnamed protein product [Mytilus edulis]